MGIGYAQWLLSTKKEAIPSEEKKSSRSNIEPSSAWEFKTDDWEITTLIQKETPSRTALTVATFNILMNDVRWMDWISRTEERWDYQLDFLLPHLDADVICLNEVCQKYIEKLTKRKWIQDKFMLSDLDPSLFTPRGNLILCKKDLARRFLREITPNAKVRSTALVEIEFNTGLHNRIALISSVHFRAYQEQGALREIELRNLTNSIDKYCESNHFTDLMILGDFNFHSEEENKYIPSSWIDVWSKKWKLSEESKSNGYTFDSNVNKMIRVLYPPERRTMRLDRFLYKVPKPLPESIPQFDIDMFATQPIPTASQPYIYPSDHFGLKNVISFVDTGNK